MIPKKTLRADLEHRRTAFFVTGLIIALAAVLISFEWTAVPRTSYSINSLNEIDFEVIRETRYDYYVPQVESEAGKTKGQSREGPLHLSG